MATTHHDVINTDLLAFFKVRPVLVDERRGIGSTSSRFDRAADD